MEVTEIFQIFLASAHRGRSVRSMGCPVDKTRGKYLRESPLIILIKIISELLMRMLKTWKLAENYWRKMRVAWWAVGVSIQEHPDNRRKLENFGILIHHENCVLSFKGHIRVSRWTAMFTQKVLISEGNLRCIFFCILKELIFSLLHEEVVAKDKRHVVFLNKCKMRKTDVWSMLQTA